MAPTRLPMAIATPEHTHPLYLLKKTIKLFHMKLDENLYIQIYVVAREAALKHGFDIQTADQITQETALELLNVLGDKDKMEKVLGGIAQLGRLPAALFIVDIGHEHIALAEAKRLGITTIGMVDTNCDPNKIDYPIPANDDATKSIAIITNYLTAAVAEGLQERQAAKEEEVEEVDNEAEKKAQRLMAEAEAEGGRGGRGGRGGQGRGPGGGQPKRRVPGGASRRTGGGPQGGGGGPRR